MRNLSDFIFTPRSDRAESFEGWNLNVGSSVDTLSGNDTIIGNYSTDAPYPSGGIGNGGLIETGAGIDTLEGHGGISNSGTIHTGASSDNVLGIAIYESDGLTNSGIINSGSGDDYIRGSGVYRYNGITNTGTIYSGPGNDEIRGGTGEGTAIYNSRMIRTACGNDRIFGWSEDQGIFNTTSGSITTGEGNDIIETNASCPLPIYNLGLIDMGAGSDTILVPSISNEGVIHLGDGNDRIISPPENYYGNGSIYNKGLITTGAGSDIVDMIDGIRGGGTLDFGTGNDTLRGFGPTTPYDQTSSMFIGGTGIDTLTFAPGRYQVQAVGPNEYLIDQQMRVSGFERFGRGAGFLNLSEAAALGSVTFV
jgi:hypothetical protein